MSFCKRKSKICLIFGLSILILLGSLWWLNSQPTVEAFEYLGVADEDFMRGLTSNINYLETTDDPSLIELINYEAYDIDIINANRSIYVSDPTFVGKSSNFIGGEADYSLGQVTTDIMNKNPTPHLDWAKVSVSDTLNSDRTITLLKTIDPPIIITDTCSKKSLLNSKFKDDICVKHYGDNVAINEKCQELSANNCKIPDCCVLINGNKCVAGNANGPTFLSENGSDMDYSYYYHKYKCYGDCESSKNYKKECSDYAPGSIGVSKECMVKMFNDYGCPNKNPDALINDAMVQSHSKTSKRFVEQYIKTAVDTLKKITDTESKALCYGIN